MFDLQKAINGAKLKTVGGIKVIHFWHKCENENLVVLETMQIYWADDFGRSFTVDSEMDVILDNTEELWVAVSKVTPSGCYYSSRAYNDIDSLKEFFLEKDFTYHKITREL